jgi:murein DD-endopeptidase MepM/ murein hydrolase activator NlpD
VRREYRVTLDAKALGLADGPAELVVAAQDHSIKGLRGNRTFLEIPVTVDTEPPRLEVLSRQLYVNRGGAGLVVYRLGEETAESGVEVAGLRYPGYPAGGTAADARVVYFAVPPDAPPDPTVTLFARDSAGNEARRNVPVRLRERSFRTDTITISDRFLDGKIPEFRAADPTLPADPVEAFLVVNRDWRARDHERIRELCASSVPERLWDGAFVQMRNTKNMAGWAERRTYRYEGRVIDSQTHLGIDLASTAGAPVPAANAGVVAYAGELGIYGQAVLLDHGQGIFTLYGHLAGVAVRQGERVARGAVLGPSGRTGMAGGDHLHLSVLVSGTFVAPAEWLDAHWIADNIENKLALVGAAR